MSILLGTAKVDITPKIPVPLAGFESRRKDGSAGEASNRLYARIFYFRQSGGEGNKTDALLVTADLIWWGSDRVPAIKKRIGQLYSIAEENILLHATHTHSGPQTSNLFTSYLGESDPAYLEQLEDALMEGIHQAGSSMESVRMEQGAGECKLGINRRLEVDGEMTLSPNPDGIVDSEVKIIRFVTGAELPKAMFVHYSCHPVITRENRFSSEFCGIAADYVEQSMGNGFVCGYLQGFCGDTNPGRNGDFWFGSNDDVIAAGRILGQTVMEIADFPMQPLKSSPLEVRNLTVLLPVRHNPSERELESMLDEPDVKAEWSRLLLTYPERNRQAIPLEMTFMRLAEGFALLSVNCEIVVEYGIYLKEKQNGQVIPLGYTNGMFGYVPTARQIAEGGYEAKESAYYFSIPAGFKDEIEDKIKTAMDCLAENMDYAGAVGTAGN
ncbi:neutral/alkaline non-lysosomal ceramidase N-terminal domain-containing protein [Paenibacillus contaminans]|uniref:Neutral/alkaline non-lysosomal ceramidase N-terminal domain-containing protein n=1 Tax=Paenibacillus contaminans TaxID=450362 RepID=A0A329MNB4_9BACL|nr:neutral/alkaline non-lysosomal ceramidase N-terminal domain-containing protein [Paenibacillus contaminans]RAV21070.1 hypothetical protein DQG23_13405 [Paenibacillus contaminans]